jgi:hypothetical protein
MQTSKLSQEVLDYIEKVVNVAKTAGIDNIIIEKDKVRAIDDDKNVVIFQTTDVPKFPFGAIGLNRISVFASRYDIAKASKDFSVEATIDDTADDEPSFVRSLLLKGKGVKIDYRCANPKTIQAPKALNDTITHKVQMTADAVQMLTKGQSAMAADEVAFAGNKNSVSLEMKDNNSDVFEYTFGDTVLLENGHKVADFHHRYPIKIINPLFKQNPDGYFTLSSRGMMNIVVNDINVFVLPRS